MLNILQAVFIAIIQGVSDVFPISSLGHSVIIPAIFHWPIIGNDKVISYLVILNFGAALGLFIYFFSEWKLLFKALLKLIKSRNYEKDFDTHFLLLIIFGALPLTFISFLFQNDINSIFFNPIAAAAFLVINGFILLIAKIINKVNRKSLKTLKNFPLHSSFLVGIFQSFSLVPGISKIGISMVASLIQGLNYEDSLKFSLMLSTPIFFGISIYQLKYIFDSPDYFFICLLGIIVALVSSFLSTKFLMKFFLKNDFTPFIYYSWIFGLIALLIFKLF